jgi:predicted secreted hydrolase
MELDEDAPAANGIRFLAGGQDDGFEHALVPRQFEFPADHGSHEGFRNEWWYFTGNLVDASGRHFGFEMTFFRIELVPMGTPRESRWATNTLWMAHFALTDTAAHRFHSAERLARGALDLAGATSEPFHVWVKDWSVRGSADDRSASLVLRAQDAEASVTLDLDASKPLVLNGDRGLDSKGPEPGNASFYYSFPRLVVGGFVMVDGATFVVKGSAWMDREWGTSALSPGVVGWDWFALQLSDGRDLMFYRLREADGGASPFSGGSLIQTDGTVERLDGRDVELAATAYWSSPHTGVRYPVSWRIGIPRHRVDLVVEPTMYDQELDLSVRYWEGAVRVTGSGDGDELTGQGYLELAGY